jgi:hypothetical protein
MIVSADLLARLTANALLYVNAKSLRTAGLSRFRIASGTISVIASDDYIAIFDIGSISDATHSIDFVLDQSQLKLIEEFARKNKKYDCQLDFGSDFDTLTLTIGEDVIKVELPEYDERVANNYEMAEAFLFDEEQFPATATQVWAFQPTRVAKLYRLKVEDNDAPIDFKFCETSAQPIVRFRYGKSIVGIIAPMRREQVNEEYLW